MKEIVQREVLIPTKLAPTNVGTSDDKLYKVFELLEEIEDEAKKMNSKYYYIKHVVCQLFQRLELIDDSVATNLRITDNATYKIYLGELNNAADVIVQLELEYIQKAILWPNDWLTEKEVNQLDLTQLRFSKASEINIPSLPQNYNLPQFSSS